MLKGICTTVAAPLLSVVTGTVQDASTGEAVIGAAVILQNTTYGAVADADGRFVINNVKPGTYTIEVQMLSYQRVVIEGCQIKPGENTLPLISLQPSAEEIDEVVVTTVRRLSREAAVMQASDELKRRGKTMGLVSHRASTCAFAEFSLSVEHGRLS